MTDETNAVLAMVAEIKRWNVLRLTAASADTFWLCAQVERDQARIAELEAENERLLNDWAGNLARDLVALGEAEYGKVGASFSAAAASRIGELETELARLRVGIASLRCDVAEAIT